MCGKARRKSFKLSPLEKLVEKLPRVFSPLNSLFILLSKNVYCPGLQPLNSRGDICSLVNYNVTYEETQSN